MLNWPLPGPLRHRCAGANVDLMPTAPNSPPGALTAERQAGFAALAAVESEWRALAAESGACPLVGPDWVQAHVRAYRLERCLHLLTVRSAGRLVAVLPLLLRREWMRGVWTRRLTGVAGRITLRFDLTCTAGPERSAALATLWGALARWDAWTCMELQPVPAGGAAEELLRLARQDGFPAGVAPAMRTPVIDLRAGADAALSRAQSRLRRKLRRNRARLAELGGLELRVAERPEAELLERFFRLEAAGWKGKRSRGGKAVLRRPPAQRRFYHALADAAGRHAQFRLHELWLPGRLLAAGIGLCDAHGFYAVKWCYDEAYAPFTPGLLLIEDILRDCERRKLPLFDFTGPDFRYKLEWTGQTLDHQFLFVFRPTLRGRALHRLKFGWR
jgi:CelD/BcsL family acetyltransferase involved in cellulose biosynthesis